MKKSEMNGWMRKLTEWIRMKKQNEWEKWWRMNEKGHKWKKTGLKLKREKILNECI